MSTKKKDVAIIDYGMGNLFSVQQACRSVGMNPVITNDKKVIINADAVILPGVGAFGTAMGNLNNLDLVNPVKDFIKSGRPFMGVCLGLQLLFTESEEFGKNKGLDVVSGFVKKFPAQNNSGEKIRVPQIGWNKIMKPADRNGIWKGTPLKNISNHTYMYFVHSFYVVPESDDKIFTYTDYKNIRYCSAIHDKNLYAFQFHPEKSAKEGLKIYQDWLAKL